MTHITNPTSLDTMFDMLANAYRRHILLAVAGHNPQTETEFPPEPFSPDNTDETEGDQVKIEGVHTHLPKLADAGYIDWNPTTETIRRGPNFEAVAPLLELIVKHEEELPADWP